MEDRRDDLATPLSEVTFVVLDLETTGASPATCAITEVGALRFRGGECLGTFQTLVNPGIGLPPDIVYLTGITELMVAPAPTIDSVLPAFAEFIGDAVIVGHNIRFDLAFLRADLARLGYPPLTNRSVDTLALARRLVRDEVVDCRLATLARHIRTDADPCHRALDDARATAELFHHLLGQVGSIGINALDDLLALPATAGHPQSAKLRWIADVPRAPGVYLFRDGGGDVLFVDRATDLRRRVRGHFAGRDGRRIGPLLREAQSFEHVACATDLEAAILEIRLLHAHRPRYNRQVATWNRRRHLLLSAGKRSARIGVVAEDGIDAHALGPFPTPAAARRAAKVIEAATRALTLSANVPVAGVDLRSPDWRDAARGLAGSCTASRRGTPFSARGASRWSWTAAGASRSSTAASSPSGPPTAPSRPPSAGCPQHRRQPRTRRPTSHRGWPPSRRRRRSLRACSPPSSSSMPNPLASPRWPPSWPMSKAWPRSTPSPASATSSPSCGCAATRSWPTS